GGEPARAAHALCGPRRDGVGSHSRRGRVLRVQSTTGSNAASGVGGAERRQGEVGRKGGPRGARSGAPQSVSFAFVSFAADRGERRYGGRDPVGAGSAAEEWIGARAAISL